MAALRCGEDVIVSRDQVCRSSQYGVIKRKSTGSNGSGGAYTVEGFGALLVDANRYPNILDLTLDMGGCDDADRPQTTQQRPTQPILSGKHCHLPAKKVKEIEHWLASIELEGDDGSLEAY
jgi:hypothetical protein